MLTLELRGSFANEVRQVLDIVTGGNTEAADKVFGRSLHISVAVIHRGSLILGPAEVGIAGDRSRAVKVLETRLGFSLSSGVEALTPEELVGGDTLLGAESRLGLGELLVYFTISMSKASDRTGKLPSAADLAGATAPKPSFLGAGGFET